MVILERSIYWNFFSRLVTTKKYILYENDVLLTFEGPDAVVLGTLAVLLVNSYNSKNNSALKISV